MEGTRPCGYYTLISSSPVPLPPKRRKFVPAPWIRQTVLLLVGSRRSWTMILWEKLHAAPMDSPGGSPLVEAGRTWTTILWEKSHAAPMSSPPQDSVLPAPTFSRRCLNMLEKRPCLLVFHTSSRRRFFYGTILRTVHRSLSMVAS